MWQTNATDIMSMCMGKYDKMYDITEYQGAVLVIRILQQNFMYMYISKNQIIP